MRRSEVLRSAFGAKSILYPGRMFILGLGKARRIGYSAKSVLKKAESKKSEACMIIKLTFGE